MATDDTHRTLRTHYVFNKEGRFAHHRPPSGLVPAHRAVGEGYLQMTVVVHIIRHLIGESGSYPAHAHGTSVCHQAHHVYVVHSTVHNWRHRAHELTMRFPHVTATLLVEVHAHHQGLA